MPDPIKPLEGLVALLLALESICLIDEGGAFETGNGDLVDIAHSKVSMQRLLEGEGLRRIIASFEFHFQLRAERRALGISN